MLRSIELDIARRLSFSKHQRAFTRWVAGFAALGMALGVASLIVVLSVMNGLAGELTGRLLNAIPHVELRFQDYDGDAQALAARVESSQPGVIAVPYIKRQVMTRSAFGTSGAELMGLGTGSIQLLNVRVVDGSLQGVMTQPYHIALGAGLANSLGVGIGDSVEVVLPRLTITPFGILPRYRKLRVGA
ncbi:ABC transporter permease, partial [Luminiphilus sp.]|nr:ABC transporter permease [Luminiphilus sp.]